MINLIADSNFSDLNALLESGDQQSLSANGMPEIIKMQPGMRYVLVQKVDGKNELLQDLVALRKGNDLIVYHADGSEIVFQDYYLFCAPSEGEEQTIEEICSVTVAGKDGSEHVFTKPPGDAALTSTDTTSIVYTQGDQTGLEAMVMPAAMTEEPTIMASSDEDNDSGAVFGSALALLGGAALASSSSSSLSASETAQPVSRTYSATAALGPMTDGGEGSVITLFKADGSLLGVMTRPEEGATNFTFTDTSGYTGILIARLVDEDESNDYMDEATATEQDITANLYVVAMISESNINISLSITPLSTVAAQEMGLVDNGDSVVIADDAQVVNTNKAVAQAFGLGDDVDIAHAEVLTTISTTGQNMSNANAYGQALALVSSLEQTTQADDSEVTRENATQTVIANIVRQLEVDESTGSLSQQIQDDIVESAAETGMGAGDAMRLLQGSDATNTAPTGVPTFTGTVAQGETLRAQTSAIEDEDGIPADGFRYQWQANNINIPGATSDSLLLTQDHVGKTITLVVSYTDGEGVEEAIESIASTQVADIDDEGTIANIIGTATQGEILTAGEITDIDGGVTGQTYLWKNGTEVIQGATASTYTLTQNEVGGMISVVVTYTDDQGTGKTVTSAATTAVANIDDAGSIADIQGTATQGQIITAGTITDIDGGVTGETYQWMRGSDAIAGETDSTYTLSQADVGEQIHVVVTYTDAHGSDKTVTSEVTAVVTDVDDPGTIADITSDTDTMAQNSVLTAGAITDIDGGVTGQTYQWMRGSEAIAGETGNTYTLSQADVGEQIHVVVTYTDAQGTGKTVTSAATDSVANINDLGQVTITGLVAEGEQLTATITDIDGEVSSQTYQWYADDTPITGATGETYTLMQAHAGADITVAVTYTDGFGADQTATSEPVSDQTAPSVTEVTITGLDSDDAVTTDTLVAGGKVKVVVQMSEPVFLSGDGGNPSYTINLGDSNKTVTYVSGLGSNTLVFTYTITANDVDLSGGVTAGSEALAMPEGTTLQDAAGNNANLTTPAPSTNMVSVDAASPVFTTTQLTASENSTEVGTVEVTDDSAITDYQLAGDDAELFSITDAGVLAFRAAQNYESPNDSGNDSEYEITVTATDANGNTTSQAVTVQLQDANETPTLTSEIENTTATVNQRFTLDVSNNFSDPDAGDTLTYSATGLPAGFSINSDGVITGNASAAIAAQNITVTATDEDGLTVTDTFSFQATEAPVAPTVTSSLQGETNIDVRSPIVLTFNENVSAATGNIVIRDLNTDGVGWKNDTTNNTQTIDVTNTDLVTINGNVVTINPTYDLDFSTNYEITMGAGVFTGDVSGEGSTEVATGDLTFSTVLPALDNLGTLSKIQESGTDALIDSNYWIDGHQGDPTSDNGVAVDAGASRNVAVAVTASNNNQYTTTAPGHIQLNGDTDLSDIIYFDGANVAWAATFDTNDGWTLGEKLASSTANTDGQLTVFTQSTGGTVEGTLWGIYNDAQLVLAEAGTVIYG